MNQYQNNFARPPPPSCGFSRFNGYPRFRFGGQNPQQHPAYFNNPLQNSKSSYFVRYGPPPMQPPPVAAGFHWRFQKNSHSTNTSNSSLIPITTTTNPVPSRPRGPRTPPYPPPPDDSEPELAFSDYESVSPKKRTRPGNKERRNKQKLRKLMQQEKNSNMEHHIQRRRNSCPTQPQRRLSQNAHNSNYNNSSPTDSHKAPEEPSPLNTAVQSYLLQVLTSQPPPGCQEQTLVNPEITAPSTYPALIHPPPPTLPPSSQTPPPLPPSSPPPSSSEDKDQETNADSSNRTTPALIIDIPNEEDFENDKAPAQPFVKIKAKRKKISSRNGSLKDWTMEEAQMALKTEQELSKEVSKDTILYLRFPDPPLNREMVKAFSADIESVHFQQNSAPRFCFAHLKEGVDVDKIIENISKIPFGMGFVKAELRQMPVVKSSASIKVENIDPFTLYVGNLSTTVPCKVLKEHFPRAARIDIGFAQRMKYTRYAFIRFHKVEEAIAAYRRMLNSEIEGRSLILRFRRFGAASKNDDAENLLATLHEEEELVDAYSMINTSASEIRESMVTPPTTEGCGEKEICPVTTKESLDKPRDAAQITKENVMETAAAGGSEEVLQKDKEIVDNVADDAVEIPTENIQNKSPIPKAIETEAVREISVELRHVTDVNQQIESHADAEDHALECGVNKSSDRLEARREKQTPDAALENANVNIEHINAQTVPSRSTDSTRGSCDVDDMMVPSITAGSIKSEPDQSAGEGDLVSNADVHRQRRCGDMDIKEESQLDYEFFSGGSNSHNDAGPKTLFPNTSVASADSNDSSCSLSEFLRLCESSRGDSCDELDDSTVPPPAKRPKSTESQLVTAPPAEIKLEPAEDLKRATSATFLKVKDTTAEIKLELNTVDNDILIIDSDDYLSPTELISQPALHSKIVVDYDEDMVPSNAFSAQPLHIKEETLDWELKSRSAKTVRAPRPLRKQTIETNVKQDSTKTRQAKRSENSGPSKSKTQMLAPEKEEEDDDDLVPANNALCTRQSSAAFFDLTVDDEPVVSIKKELETQDLFSLPKSRATRGKEALSANTNRRGRKDLKSAAQNNKSPATHCNSDDNDDDVIIIRHSSTFPMPRRSTLCSDESETSRIKRETSPFLDNHRKSKTNIEKSVFDNHKISRHGDNLDRLFELLNSDAKEDDEL